MVVRLQLHLGHPYDRVCAPNHLPDPSCPFQQMNSAEAWGAMTPQQGGQAQASEPWPVGTSSRPPRPLLPSDAGAHNGGVYPQPWFFQHWRWTALAPGPWVWVGMSTYLASWLCVCVAKGRAKALRLPVRAAPLHLPIPLPLPANLDQNRGLEDRRLSSCESGHWFFIDHLHICSTDTNNPWPRLSAHPCRMPSYHKRGRNKRSARCQDNRNKALQQLHTLGAGTASGAVPKLGGMATQCHGVLGTGFPTSTHTSECSRESMGGMI